MKGMNDLTKGNTFKTLFIFAIPLMISLFLSQTYNLIDLIVAGKVIGSDALSATGSTTTFIQFLSSLFWGFGVAISTVIGELFGAKKHKEIVTSIKTGMIFVTITMFILSLGCFIFARQILTLLKVDPLIFDDAKSYFQIFMVALFIQAITYQITCILHSLGNAKYPMVMTAISGVGNVLLNVLFVIPLQMGINGLAYASIISSLIALIMGLVKMVQTIYALGGNMSYEFDTSSLRIIGKLAIPCILQQCSLYLSSVIVQPYVNDLGKAVSAGYSIAMNAGIILNACYHSVSRAVASYAAQSKGSKQYNNYSKGIYIGMLIQVILTTPLAIAFIIWPNEIFSIFLKNNDASVLPYATQYISLCLPFILFLMYGNLMHSFYKSVEAVKTVVFTTTIFTIARIVFTYTIPNDAILRSVYLGLSLAWVSEAVILAVIYYLGIWKNKEENEK